MKRTVAATLGLVAITSTAVGQQGHIGIWNYYVPPYNQVVWADISVPGVGGTPVVETSVLMNFWIAPGVVTNENALSWSGQPSFTVNPNILYDGGGYYDAQLLLTPEVGLYTVQIRASGDGIYGPVDEERSRSFLFQVETRSTALPALIDDDSVGLVVYLIPEPTTLALIGLTSLALVMVKRRK